MDITDLIAVGAMSGSVVRDEKKEAALAVQIAKNLLIGQNRLAAVDIPQDQLIDGYRVNFGFKTWTEQ